MASGHQENVEKRSREVSSLVKLTGLVVMATALMIAVVSVRHFPKENVYHGEAKQYNFEHSNTPLAYHFKHSNTQLAYAANKSVVICWLPKVASSVMLMLVKRMNGVPNWNSTLMHDIRGWLRQREAVQDADLQNPDIGKMAMVRNPVDRLLSGYLNKMVEKRYYRQLPEGSWTLDENADPPTFEEFVNIIDSVPQNSLNKHFKPQSMLCQTDRISYTLVDFADREKGMREFLKSIGEWEDMGASGWGPNKTSPIFGQTEHIIPATGIIRPTTVSGNRDDIIKQYYTRELLKKVFRIFEMDFKAFGELGWSQDPDTYLNGA